ncbi:helix-turn-helix domain-containing protein [uncultured Acinetobacter sp.]
MLKAYKYRLYPSREQRVLIEKNSGLRVAKRSE